MPQGPGTYGKKVGRPAKKKASKKSKKRKQIMSGKRLDLFNHDKKARSKGAYHI